MRLHEEFMLLERDALDERIAKLDYFLAGKVVGKLDLIDRDLLHAQYKAMCYYRSILYQRIGRIKAE